MTPMAPRSRRELDDLRQKICAALKAIHPATVRQTFYQLAQRGVSEKTEAQYDTVARVTGDMRRAGQLPYDWLADNSPEKS